MFKKDLLKGKRILVTGGGTGLGREMASHYAEHGADLYICGRRENVLKDTADQLIGEYGTHRINRTNTVHQTTHGYTVHGPSHQYKDTAVATAPSTRPQSRNP